MPILLLILISRIRSFYIKKITFIGMYKTMNFPKMDSKLDFVMIYGFSMIFSQSLIVVSNLNFGQNKFPNFSSTK